MFLFCLSGLGFIHNDIKPSNFAIGQGSVIERRKICLLDFGLCKSFDPDAFNPDAHSPYCATVLYASLASHKEKAHCYADDIESFMYMIIDFTSGTLSWKGFEDNETVLKIKEDRGCELFKDCPKEYRDMFDLNCRKQLLPSFDLLYSLFDRALQNTDEYPYDWEVDSTK